MPSQYSVVIPGFDPHGRKSVCQDSVEVVVVNDHKGDDPVEVARIMVVCDGVGTCERSEVGSFVVARLVVETIRSRLEFIVDDGGHSGAEIEAALRGALSDAHARIVQIGWWAQRVHDWMATTIVVMVVAKDYASAWMVGDGAVGCLLGEGARAEGQLSLTTALEGDHGLLVRREGPVIYEEPNNGNRIAMDASRARRRGCAVDFWTRVLRVYGPIRHAFISTDGIRHRPHLKAMTARGDALSPEQVAAAAGLDRNEETVGYVDDLAMAWWFA